MSFVDNNVVPLHFAQHGLLLDNVLECSQQYVEFSRLDVVLVELFTLSRSASENNFLQRRGPSFELSRPVRNSTKNKLLDY
jgi:hypothetical protein